MDLETNLSMLIRSASEGNYEEMCEILNTVTFDKGYINQALLKAVNKSQSTSDHLSCIERLLTQGNPNLKDSSGVSLLMIAAKLGQIQLATHLIDCGSTVDDRDKDMRTPLMYAVDSVYGDNVDVVKILLENGAKVNHQDLNGNSPLHRSAERGYHNSMAVLLEYGAYVNAENKDKNTPLHLACKFGFENCAELLISKKANIAALNLQGKSPKDLSPENVLFLFEKPTEISSNSDADFRSMSSSPESFCQICKRNINEFICKSCYESNTQSAQEKKILAEAQKEILELKQQVSDLLRLKKLMSEEISQIKQSCLEKEQESLARELDFRSQQKASTDLFSQIEEQSKSLNLKLKESSEEIESLREQLLNAKNELKLHRSESENLRKRLEEFNQRETEIFASPSKTKRNTKPFSYIKQYVRSDGSSQTAQLRDEINIFMREIEKWQEDVEPIFNELTAKIRRSIKKKFPGCDLEIYGSFATKLHLPSSDIDMVIMNLDLDKREALQILEKTLKGNHFIRSTVLIKATVPVIKVKAEIMNREIFVDITVNDSNHSGLKCLPVVNRLLSQYSMIRPVFLILKHLLYACNFKEPFNGGLGSYSLFLMVSSYLQKRAEVNEKSRNDLFSPADCLYDILVYYENTATYMNPIITKDPLIGPLYQPRNYDNYISLKVIDPLNSLNNVAIKTNLLKLIHIFNIAHYNLKRSCLCDCTFSNSPLYRMIYETKEYIKNNIIN